MNRIRNVTFQIKAGKTTEFGKVMTNDVLPLLRKQPGFKHELAMVSGNSAVGLSVWEDQRTADQYGTTVYPEVLKKLTPVLEGTPQVTSFDLAASTIGN